MKVLSSIVRRLREALDRLAEAVRAAGAPPPQPIPIPVRPIPVPVDRGRRR